MLKLRPYQEEASRKAVEFLKDESKTHNAMMILPTGCHAKGTKILMHDGTLKNVEDIKDGDMLMGNDSTPRRVLSLHRGEDEMYRIVPRHGEPFIVNGGHILHLYKVNEGEGRANGQPRYDEISVSEYLFRNDRYKHVHKLHKAKGVTYDERNKSIEPYFLGLFLGDGTSRSGIAISTMHEENKEYIYRFAERYGFQVRVSHKEGGKASDYHFVFNGKEENPLKTFLMDMELFESRSGDKFIPQNYKIACRRDRLLILAGLLDTDGYYDTGRNGFEYSTKSPRLADDVCFLCWSLGFYARKKEKIVNGTMYYRIHIYGDLNEIPTRIATRRGRKRKQKKSIYVEGFDVEPVGKGKYYGFTLDGNHLYLDGQFYVHHNSGKSLVIADMADRLNTNVLVLQPSREILVQNYNKMKMYTDECSMYSASVGKKEINKVTFAMIGSIFRNPEEFKDFKYVISDECHLTDAEDGMYRQLYEALGVKVLGLTATPYRLYSQLYIFNEKTGKKRKNYRRFDPNSLKKDESYIGESTLKFLTNIEGGNFKEVLFCVQVKDLMSQGFLAKTNYYEAIPPQMKHMKMYKNSSGSDYSESSVKFVYDACGMHAWVKNIVSRLLVPKSGIPRKGIIVFTKFVEEAVEYANYFGDIAGVVSGDMKKKDREQVLEEFRQGKKKIIFNANCLVVGFDYPELDTIVMARPTLSLAVWYQAVGRVLRPHPNKEASWVVDLCMNYQRFGKVEDLEVECNHGFWRVQSHGKQLTDVIM